MGFQLNVSILNKQPHGTQNFVSKCLLFAGLLLLATPASAHKTEVSGDVAGIWHVEPNHRPRSGQPARIWVALTRRGGQILSLQDAQCQMAIYREPHKADNQPILRPSLTAINVERYRGVPSATVILPAVGLYQAKLSCSPKGANKFRPFQMQYRFTVAR